MSILNNINIISDIINYMRILLVTSLPPPRAGMSLQGQYTLNILRDLGHKVRVFKINHRYIVKVVLAILLPVIIPIMGFLTNRVVIFSVSTGSFYFYTLPILIYSRLTGKPSILFFKGGIIEKYLKRFPIIRHIFKLADRVVVPGNFLKDVLSKYGILSSIMPDIIDTTHLTINKNFKEGAYFLITRSLNPTYQIDVAIKAFHKVKHKLEGKKLIITGDGPERKNVEGLIRELELEDDVILRGECNADEIGELLSNAFALLNTSYYDNYPNSILEAFYTRVPVLTTNAGGIPYIVNDRINGFIINKGDTYQMAKEIMKMVKNKDQIENIVDNAKNDFERLTLTYKHKNTSTIINKLILHGRL